MAPPSSRPTATPAPNPADRPETWLAHYRGLLERERAATRAQYEALRASASVQERVERGLAQDGLVVTDTGAESLGRTAWTLAAKDGGELGPGASPGDPVRIYRKRAEEQAVRALVVRRTRRQLVVVFDDAPEDDLDSSELVVERENDETTHARLLAGLGRLELGKGRTRQWLELLLGRGSPEVDRPVPFESTRLNPPQVEAVRAALRARDLFLVHGPPGTGKTEVLAAVAAEHVRAGRTILACAPSNAAVDNLVQRLGAWGVEAVRLGHPARVHPDVVERTLEARVKAHEKARIAATLTREARELMRRADRAQKQGRASDRFAEARAARGEAKRLFTEARQLVRAAEGDILERASVVACTLTGAADDRLRDKRFDVGLLDEATQATVPASVLPLLRVDRIVLAGDHHQLPPTVIDPGAAKDGLDTSLYELWRKGFPGHSHMLVVQHRMHAEIMRYPSEALYEGKLVAHPSVAAHLLRDLPGVTDSEPTHAPLLFVDTAGKGWNEETPHGSESKRNEGEAGRVVREVEGLLALGVRASEIGVIAPYSAQVQLLRTLLEAPELEIDSVDAFQGREKEAIVLSLVRSNDEGALGFTADVRRLNVAITRARRRLVVIGDSATLGGHPFHAAFHDSGQARGAWRSAWDESEDDSLPTGRG